MTDEFIPLSEWLASVGACEDSQKYADVNGYLTTELRKALDEMPEYIKVPCSCCNPPVSITVYRDRWVEWLRDIWYTIPTACRAAAEYKR